MKYKRLKNGVFVDTAKEKLKKGDRIKKEVVKGVWVELNYSELQSKAPIRIISTGAMQRRFTIQEEVFIDNDAVATVIKSRLINSNYCDLDFQDVINGINSICGVLKAGGIIADVAIRASELLQDGVPSEQP